jgi:hypothetical protein
MTESEKVFMKPITRFFVRAHHWQVLALLIGLSFITDITEIVVIWTYPKTVALIAAELRWICFVLWFWSLGSFLNSVAKSNLRLSLPFLRLALVYPLVYMGIFQIIPFERLTLGYNLAIVPFHLFAMFCVFFDLNFVSKSLALAERGRAVSFYDYAGSFFLLCCFPLGIWFIQPRINRLYAGTLNQQSA